MSIADHAGRRFLGFVAGATLFWCVLLVVAPATILRAPPEQAWLAAIIDHKTRAADAIPSPRIVILGGSNVLFGIDSPTLAAATGRPVLNLGIHAGLGLDYLLHLADPLPRPDDVVVLMLEYRMYSPAVMPNDVLAAHVAYSDAGYLQRRPVMEWPAYLFGVNPVAGVAATFRHLLNIPVLGGYSASNLTASGDDASNTGPGAFAGPLAAPPATIAPVGSPEIEAALAAQVTAWRNRGATVVATWPALLSHPAFAKQEYRDYFAAIEALLARLAVPMAGRPEDGLLPAGMIFDTANHATRAGAIERSRRLAAALGQLGIKAD